MYINFTMFCLLFEVILLEIELFLISSFLSQFILEKYNFGLLITSNMMHLLPFREVVINILEITIPCMV